MTKRWLAVCAIALAAPAAAATFRELQGDEQFAVGRFDMARALYREALRAEPENRTLWVKYDLAYVRELGGKAAPRAPGRTFARRVKANAQMVARADAPAPRLRTPFEELRARRALGAPVGPVGPAAPAEMWAALRPRPGHKPEPELDREVPMEPLPAVPAPLPSVPQPEPEATPSPSPAPEAQPSPAAEPPPAEPAITSPPEVPPLPEAVRSAPLQLSPAETVPVPPVAPGENVAPSVGAFGEPIVVRGAGYDVWDLRYGVDLAGKPHVMGKVRNLTDRDIVNPTIYVGLIDPSGVQVAFRPVKMEDPAGVVFPGGSRDFDAEFPAHSNPIAGYRVFMLGR